MPDGKTRTYTVSGLSTIALPDGTIIHKLMIRLRNRNRRRAEVWIDCTDDFCYEIGDTVMIKRVKPYQIVQEQEEGETDVRHCSDE